MPLKIIDTHIHVWDFDKAEYEWLKGNTSILNRSYTLEELEQSRLEAGVSEGVLVQAANNLEDTDWMLDVAQHYRWIKGVVGWLPLLSPTQTEDLYLKKYKQQSLFKGIRHLIHDEPDAQWLLQPQVIESLNILSSHQLTFDIVGVLDQHIETAIKLSSAVPSMKMVFDHLNQPPVAKGEKFGRWGALMKEAAQHPQFNVKISGLGTTCAKANWCANDLQPYIEFVLTHFGVDRCFCGGDWPVALLAGSYVSTWKIYKDVLTNLLNPREQEKVFFTNAKKFYDL